MSSSPPTLLTPSREDFRIARKWLQAPNTSAYGQTRAVKVADLARLLLGVRLVEQEKCIRIVSKNSKSELTDLIEMIKES